MIEKEVSLYIEEVSLENSDLTILLHKNIFPFYFDEDERKPFVKIIILNYDLKIPLDDIPKFIDNHNDGVFFEINNEKTTISFKDFEERVATLSGAEILVEEIEYSKEQLWEIIIGLRKAANVNCEIISNLNSKIEKTFIFIDKEIDRNQKLLSQIDSSKIESINKAETKMESLKGIKSLLKNLSQRRFSIL